MFSLFCAGFHLTFILVGLKEGDFKFIILNTLLMNMNLLFAYLLLN
jgi:hypothetical protein